MSTPPRPHSSFLRILARIIGYPGQGTHSAAGGAPDNWQSRNAIDIATPVGTPIYAPVGGTLGPTGSLGSRDPRFAGDRINLFGGGQGFYFAHLSRLAQGITQGATVRPGQLLGYTGSANGVSHLHFAVEHGSPLSYYQGAGGSTAPSGTAPAPAADPSSPTTGDAAAAVPVGCATIVVATLLPMCVGLGYLVGWLT